MMQEQAERIVASFGEALREGTASAASFQHALESLTSLSPVTELDRMYKLLNWVRLLDQLLDNLPEGEAQPLRDQRAEVFGLLQRQYGSTETAYVRSRSIVEEVATRLAAGEEDEAVAAEGMQALEGLEFDAADESAISTAKLAVFALNAAHVWLANDDGGAGSPAHVALRALASTLDGGFDGDAVSGCVDELHSGRLSLDGTLNGHVMALAVAAGLGLRAEPAGLPALEAPIGLVAEAWVEANGSSEEAVEAAPEQPADGLAAATTGFTLRAGASVVEQSAAGDGLAAKCAAVLAGFERAVREQGVTEYLLDQALADLRELDVESEEDGRVFRSALYELTDIAEAHATPELVEVFRAMRESLIAQDAPPLPPLDAAGIREEGEEIVRRLEAELADGVAPAVAITHAMSAMQRLSGRMPEDDEAAIAELLRLMPAMLELTVPYVEADKTQLAEDMAGMMREVMDEMGTAIRLDDAETAIASRAGLQAMEGLMQRPFQDPFEQRDAQPHQRQFHALLRPLSLRLNALQGMSVNDSREAIEAKRIAERADIALKRLRNATTDAQWIEHLRNSVRRAVVDLRRFERRYHLTLIEPPWPTPSVGVDANAVFYSGGPAARAVVEAACAVIGMDAPIAHGVDDPVHTRWDLLRRSAVGVFDFTAYDPAAADPPGPLATDPDRRTAIVRAAAPTALASYECGWAFVLGTPIVILARPERPPPFDIDVEPVILDDADDVAARVTLGIQAALLGVQRGVRTVDLSGVIARLHARFGNEPGCAELLDAIRESNDPIRVQLAASAMLERAPRQAAVLALPAFPPPPPATAGAPRTLFHVTAFRSWSKPCEEVVREVCRDEGIEYGIGYDRLDPDILGAIWQDITTASFVVADLTHLNPNAALELAIAQAVGRPTLAISQTAGVPAQFPPLAKVRVHEYATDEPGRRELERVVRRFIASAY